MEGRGKYYVFISEVSHSLLYIVFSLNKADMVGVAQLVEPRIVIPVVVGSIPIVHPSLRASQKCGES